MKYHFYAIFTILCWALTFISSKVLLNDFLPIEILIIRFALGLLALCVAFPRALRIQKRAHHLLFAVAGACGVTLYFIFEYVALQFSTAGNVSVTVATAPLFTAIIAQVINKDRSVNPWFILGFLVCMTGIVLINQASLSGEYGNLGDVLAIAAAVVWGIYSNLIKHISDLGYESGPLTRRVFLWGLLFSLVSAPFFGVSLTAFDLQRFCDPWNIFNLLYLGLLASALCFILWNVTVAHLGATKTSIYIYASPCISVIAGILILDEPLTLGIVFGIVLVLIGLILSEKRYTKEAPIE